MVQQPLLNRPGHQYDDGWKPSEGNTDELEDAYNAPDAEYPEDHPSRQKSLSDEELAESENSASAEGDTSTGTKKSEDESENEESGLYSGDGKKKKRGRITRKQGGIAGFIAALIISAFMAVITQGPGIVITHVRDMLLSRVGTVQQHHARRYRQSKISKLRNMFSRDGRMGQKIITEMETRGYKFTFDPNDRNKIIGITNPQGTETAFGEGIGKELDDFMEKRHPFRSARWKTKRMNAFYKKFGVTRTSVIDKAKAKPDEDPKRTVNREMANDVVDENPKEMRSQPATDSEDDTDAQRQENETKNNVGESTDGASGEFADEYEKVRQPLLDGDSVDEIDSSLAKSLDAVEGGISPDVLEAVNDISRGSLGGRVWNGVKGFFSPTDFLDKLCTMRNRLRLAQGAARTARAAKLLRYSAVFIKAGDGVRRGDVDSKLVNQLMKRVMSEDANGNSFGASAGYSVLANGKFSKSQNDVTRNKVAVDGKLTGVLAGIKEGTDGVPGMSKCWLWQNPAFQVGTAVLDVGVTVVGCIFSGCAASAGKEAAQEAAEQTIKVTIQNAIKRTITKRLLRDAAIGFAIDFGIDQAMTYMQMYATKTMMIAFTGQEVGGQLSNILVGGAGTLNRNRSAASGMVPATTRQYASAVQEYKEWKQEDLSKQSFFARTFDYGNPDSLAFSGVSAAIGVGSGGATTTINNLATAATGLMSGGFVSGILGTFGSSASAASDDIEFDEYTLEEGNGNRYGEVPLATDLAGNMQYIMRSDIEEIDPETNQEQLVASGDIDSSTKEPKSDAFKKYMEQCVDTNDVLSEIEFKNADCLAEELQTKKFAAHLAYLDILDGLEAEFDPSSLEDSSGQQTQQTTTGTGSLPSGNAQELARQIIASGKVTGDSRYIGQIQAVANGDNSCHINPTILGMILSLSSQFELRISSLNRRCTGVLTASGEGSYHYREQGGHAVDFNFVNGVHSTGNTEHDRALIQAAAAIVPAGSGFGQSNCRANPLTLPGMRQFTDTCNHVHIEVPVQ